MSPVAHATLRPGPTPLALSALALAGALLTVNGAALAEDREQPPAADEQTSDNPTPEDGGLAEEGAGADELSLLSDEQALQEERSPEETFEQSTDPHEDPETAYYFLGAFYRHIFLPSFVTELFLASAPSVNNPAVGAEFIYRKDGFSISASLWWASYHFVGPFRADGDPEIDTEMLNSDMSAVIANATFLWSTAFSDMVALEYGLDAGVAIIAGSYDRTEARPAGQTTRNVHDGWVACDGPGRPAEYIDYCAPGPLAGDGEEGEHYNVRARKWAQGGSVPNILPWVGPHFALRVKPLHQLALRAELGLGLGFFVGLSAHYGF